MDRSRLYVTGLWIIPDNVKRNQDHYSKLLDATFKIVKDQNVLFYSDNDQILVQARALSVKYNIQLFEECVKIEDLPNAEKSRQIANNGTKFKMAPFAQLLEDGTISKENGLHAAINYTSAPELNKSFAKMTQIYLSRVGLLHRAAKNYDHKEFIWFDVSVSRFNHSRDKADFTKWKLESNRIHHYGSIMKFFGHSQPLNASVLAGDKNAIKQLNTLFNEQVSFFCQSGCTYPTDDENIHLLCYKTRPGLYKDVNFKPRNIAHKLVGKLIFVAGLNSFFAKALNTELKIVEKLP
jgi:hypothetical protein